VCFSSSEAVFVVAMLYCCCILELTLSVAVVFVDVDVVAEKKLLFIVLDIFRFHSISVDFIVAYNSLSTLSQKSETVS